LKCQAKDFEERKALVRVSFQGEGLMICDNDDKASVEISLSFSVNETPDEDRGISMTMGDYSRNLILASRLVPYDP
jgi:hypothetical protein